jgi:hypothetical protein
MQIVALVIAVGDRQLISKHESQMCVVYFALVVRHLVAFVEQPRDAMLNN